MLILLFSLLSYVAFLGAFLYSIGFTGGLVVPKALDGGELTTTGSALIVNLLLLSAFAIQHSVMARPAFKRRWTRVVHPAAERSVYVLLTSGLLALIFWQWRPMPSSVWNLSGTLGGTLLTATFWLGWGVVFISTFLLDHFELFGLKQGIMHFRGQPMPVQRFRQPFFYKLVRHPIMLGFIIAFWSAPIMSQGHLLFAAVTTVYMLVAIMIEERDLAASLGEDYRAYQKRVSMIVPFPRRKP